MNRVVCAILCLLTLVRVGKSVQAAAPPPSVPDRWVYVRANLLPDANLPPLLSLFQRIRADGYNGVVLSDYKFSLLNQMPPTYAAHAAQVRKAAQDLGLKLYVTTCQIGYSNGLLAQDPNLAEGLPVRDARFMVKGDALAPQDAGQNLLKNGDFERAKGDQFPGWDFQDAVGTGTYADPNVHHGGAYSLRMTDIGKADPQNGHGRIMQAAAVQPFHEYRLSVWIRTQDYDTPSDTRALVLAPNGHPLSYTDWDIQKTQGWTRYTLVFNSLDNTKALVYFGVWGGKHGTIWWDDARLEDAPLLNLLRRPGCPFTVADAGTGTAYQEGKDFAPVADPSLGKIPWDGEYDTAHDPPIIKRLPGSRIHDGQTLKISFYHPLIFGSDQVCACLSDPKVDGLLADEIH